MSDNELRQETALTAVRECAKLCERLRSTAGSSAFTKDDKSPVTVADFASQALIASRLAAVFPGETIVAEESSSILKGLPRILASVTEAVRGFRSTASEAAVVEWITKENEIVAAEYWTVDPLDGSRAYLQDGHYAISIGWVKMGFPIVGVLACPTLSCQSVTLGPGSGVILTAIKERGCWIQRLDGGSDRRQVFTSKQDRCEYARCCESREGSHSAHEKAHALRRHLGICGDPLRIDSQAKYGLVAVGLAEAYLRFPPEGKGPEKVWDHAPGCLLVEEAGGRVTDLAGKPLQFPPARELTEHSGLLATNGVLHECLLTGIRDLLAN